MNAKILDFGVILLILIVGIFYFRSSIELGIGSTQNIGAGFYPILLAILLIILVFLNIIQTIRRPSEEEKVNFPNGKLVVFTIALLALFILSWSIMGYFYVNLFLFIFILYSVLSKKWKGKFLLFNASFSLILTFSIFIIFDLVLNLPL